MDASVESLDGDILLKFKQFLVEEGDNETRVRGTRNVIYAFYYIAGEGNE